MTKRAAGEVAFTKTRRACLEAVAADRSLTHLAARIAFLIGTHYLNAETGDAWPGQERLAEDIGVSVRSVRRAVEQLVAAGHLEMIPARGRGNTNRYRFAGMSAQPASEQLEKRTAESGFRGENRTPVSSFEGKPENRTPQSGFKTKKRTPESAKSGLQSPPTYLLPLLVPVPSSRKKEEVQESSNSARARASPSEEKSFSTGFGTGNGGPAAYPTGSVTIADPLDRLARFKAKLAGALGPQGWKIVESASDRVDSHHEANLFLCKQVARRMRKGWPRLWFSEAPAAMPRGARAARAPVTPVEKPDYDLGAIAARRAKAAQGS